MEPLRQIPRALHDEHRATLALYGRLEQALAVRDREGLAAIAPALVRHLAEELARHLDFEERELFPRLADAGEGDIAALLSDEHAAIREVAAEALPIFEAIRGGADPFGQTRMRMVALELVERQIAHIQKESMALLPMLDELLDEDTDRELAFAYTAG